MSNSQKLLIIKIKNALRKNKTQITTKYSNSNSKLLKYITKEKLIEGFIKKNQLVTIFLKYEVSNNAAIENLITLSKTITSQTNYLQNTNFALDFISKRTLLLKIR